MQQNAEWWSKSGGWVAKKSDADKSLTTSHQGSYGI